MIPALLSSAAILYLYWSEKQQEKPPGGQVAADGKAGRLADLNVRLEAIHRRLERGG